MIKLPALLERLSTIDMGLEISGETTHMQIIDDEEFLRDHFDVIVYYLQQFQEIHHEH